MSAARISRGWLARESWNARAVPANPPRMLAGAPSLLSFLVARTLEPFLEAFQREPIAAVLTLAAIAHTPGADQIGALRRFAADVVPLLRG